MHVKRPPLGDDDSRLCGPRLYGLSADERHSAFGLILIGHCYEKAASGRSFCLRSALPARSYRRLMRNVSDCRHSGKDCRSSEQANEGRQNVTIIHSSPKYSTKTIFEANVVSESTSHRNRLAASNCTQGISGAARKKATPIVDAQGYFGIPGVYFDNVGSFTATFSVSLPFPSLPPGL